MFDNIKVTFFTNEVQYYKDNVCIYPKPNQSTGEEEHYIINYHGFYVHLKNKRVTIKGSLHKFHNGGSNLSVFTRSQIKAAVKAFYTLFRIKPYENELKIINYEAGVNVLTEYPPLEYADCMIRYGKNTFKPCKKKIRTTVHWGVECDTCDFHYKFYDKCKQMNLVSKKKLQPAEEVNLLRYEITYRRLSQTRHHRNLDWLHSIDYMTDLKKDMISRYRRILKSKKLNTSAMSSPILAKYYAGTLSDYWDDLYKKKPATYKKELALYKKLQVTYKSVNGDRMDELDQKITEILDFIISN